MSGESAERAAADLEVLIDRIEDMLVSYDEDGALFGTSGAGAYFLAKFLVNHGVTPRDEGCDCAELCSMGPTCPGGSLAGLPGSGCWRTHALPERQSPIPDVRKSGGMVTRDTPPTDGRAS